MFRRDVLHLRSSDWWRRAGPFRVAWRYRCMASSKKSARKQPNPPQKQRRQPGRQKPMAPEPVSIRDDYRGSGKLDGRVALISGGDSGIGRAVAIHFAREGANVAIIYLEEDGDAEDTSRAVAAEG